MMSNTTDPAERLRALAYFVAHECPPDQVEQAIQEQGELILAAAYQRGYAQGNDDQIAHSTAYQRGHLRGYDLGYEVGNLEGKTDERERIRARALEYFGDGITPREVDAILDAQADR